MSLHLGRKFLLSWVAMALGVTSNVLLYRLQLHALGPTLLGIWIAVSTACSYLTLLELGLSAAVNRHVATSSARSDDSSESQVLITALCLYSMLGLLALLVGVGLSRVVAPLLHILPAQRDAVRLVTIVLAADTAIIFFFNTFRALIMGRGHSEAVAIVTMCRHLVYSGLTILVLRHGLSLPRLALAMMVADGCAGVALATVALKLWSPASRRLVRPSAALAQRFFRASAAVVLAYAGQHLLRNAAIPLLQRSLGSEAVAQYAGAARLALLFFMIMTQVGTVTTPLLCGVLAQGQENVPQTLHKLARLGLAAGLAPLVIVLVMGDYILGAWLGPAMLPSSTLLHILGIGMCAQLFSLGTDICNYALGGLWSYSAVKLTFAVISLGAVWLGMRWGQTPGAAWGSALTIGLCDGLCTPIVMCRALKISAGSYYRALLRGLLPLLVTLSAAALTLRLVRPVGLHSVLALCALGTAAGWALTFQLYLEAEERLWLRGRTARRGRCA